MRRTAAVVSAGSALRSSLLLQQRQQQQRSHTSSSFSSASPHGEGETARLGSSSALPPLPPLPAMPVFRPQPFRVDKFLSIKSRSAETFIEARRGILARSAKLRERVEELNHPDGDGDGEGSGVSSALFVDQLPPALVDEIVNLQKKVELLEGMQGFVLTDEMVYRTFHNCVHIGAHRDALQEWLLPRILGEKRGPVFPSFLLEDLLTIVECCLLSTLPDGQASVSMLSALPPRPRPRPSPCRSSSVGRAVHRQRVSSWLSAAVKGSATPTARRANTTEPEEEEAQGELSESVFFGFPSLSSSSSLAALTGPEGKGDRRPLSRYARHRLQQYGLPLLSAVNALGIFFSEVRPEGKEEREERGGGGAESRHVAWLPPVTAQACAARRLVRRFSSNHSFLSSPPEREEGEEAMPEERSSGGDGPPMERGSGDSSDASATLGCVTRLYCSLAQCAAEIRANRLLLALFAAFARGFLCRREDGQVGLSTEVWVDALSSSSSPSPTEMERSSARDGLSRFAAEFLSIIFYGRQAILADRSLWQAHDVLQLTEALRTATTTAAVSWKGDGRDNTPSEGSHEDSETSRRESAMAHVHALASSLQAQDGDSGLETVLSHDLPRFLQEGLLASYAETPEATALWGEAAAIAESVLANVSAAAPRPEAAEGDEHSESISLSASLSAARVYVAVVKGSVEGVRSLETGSSGAFLTNAELETVCLGVTAAQQLKEEVHRLRHGETPTEATAGGRGEEESRADSLVGSEEKRRLLLSAAAGAAAESCWQVVDGLVEALTAETLARALQLLRGCYRQSSSPPSTAAGLARPEVGLSGGGGGEEDFANADTNNNNSDDDDDSDAVEAALQVQEEVGEGEESEDGPRRGLGGNEEAGAHEELQQRQAMASRGLASSIDTDAFCAAFNAEAPTALKRIRGELERFLLWRIEAGDGSVRVRDWLTPASAARLALLYAPFAGDLCEHPSSSFAFYQELTTAVCQRLSAAASLSGASAPPVFGNAPGLLLLSLARAGHWSLAKELLQSALLSVEPSAAPDVAPSPRVQEQRQALTASPPLLSSVTVEPEVFAETFQRARDDGASEVCLLLRQNRERLFF